jgi:hypothetical protein
MTRVPLIIHERLGTWARQLRPRVVGWSVRVVETRSADDLETALGRDPCPLVVIDLGGRTRAVLEELDRAAQQSPNALVLVLDPSAQAGVAPLARELGATHVLSGAVPPPMVVALLARWLPLARRRAEADGWWGESDIEPDPWGRLEWTHP